ncbi:MAG TPA: hypothetical protein VMV92_03040 [Streptosporangiaceae bacterium]|nr:hypothetical protein [Streptosporangiaceae bacterium]
MTGLPGTWMLAYDLAGNWCEECGRAMMSRLLLAGTLTGCKTCDVVTTRHRCASRPDISELHDGQSWQCGDCDSVWEPSTVTEECPDCCGECGHTVQVRRWQVTEGARIGSAPKYASPGWLPMRNIFAGRPAAPQGFAGPRECHVTTAGISVHVRPGCRCPRKGR